MVFDDSVVGTTQTNRQWEENREPSDAISRKEGSTRHPHCDSAQLMILHTCSRDPAILMAQSSSCEAGRTALKASHNSPLTL